MNKNLEDYVKVYNLIDSDTCNRTIELLQQANWVDHKFYSTEGLVDNGAEPLECHDFLETSRELQQAIWTALKNYVLEDMNFSWFPGWQGFSNLKFIKYTEGSEMALHCDHIHSLYDGIHKGIPILTIIGLLNTNFEGGELVMFGDKTYSLTQGDIIIFPSVFLFPHQINRIRKGTRYSVISWSN